MAFGDLESVVGRIYEAVSETDRWVEALGGARELLEVDGMLLLYCDLAMGRPQVIASHGFDKEILSTYGHSHLADDELVLESMQVPAGVIVSRTCSWENEETRTRVFSRSVLPMGGSVLVAGAAAIRTTEMYSSLWMTRSREKVEFSGRDLRIFSQLLPHVGRAMSAHHRVTRAEFEAAMATGAIDRIAVGVVLLDANGEAVFVNREAQRIFAADNGIGMTGPRLLAADTDQTRRLRRLIRRVGGSGEEGRRDGPIAGTAIRLKRLEGRPDCHVVVLPLPRRCQPENAAGAVAVLFISDPERGQSPADFLCGDLYGLTAAEVRLVSTLLVSSGLTVAARKLGLSRNTVHSQLASIFSKTGTRSQSDLLRLILGGIAPVRVPDYTSGFYPTALTNGGESDD